MVELKDWMNKCDERSSDQQKKDKRSWKKHGSPFIVLLEESVCLLILE
jgi:hypothetical protein